MALTNEPDNGNGKVTLALLAYKLDAILAEIKMIKVCDEDQTRQIVSLQIAMETRSNSIQSLRSDLNSQQETIDEHDKELRSLENKVGWWSGMNTIGVVINAILTTVLNALKGGTP